MTDKNDTVIEGEVTGESEVKEEKKENGFSKFWNKTKKAVGDAVLENKIESSFNKNNMEYEIFQRTDVLGGKTVHGFIEGNLLTVFGKVEAIPYSIVIKENDTKAYAITSQKESTCKAVVDGVEYERPATEFTLTEDVTEVNVINAGKRYFLDKNPEAK